jgi:hypothetical protein
MGWFQSLFQRDNPASPPPGPPHQSRGLLAWAKARLGWGGPAADGPTYVPPEITAGKTRWGPADVLLPQFWPYLDPMGSGPPPRILRKMFSDPYIKGATLGKIFGVSSQDLQVRPFSKKDAYDQKIAAFSEWLFTERLDGGISDLIWNVFAPGMIEGYSLSEYDMQLERQGDWRGKVALDSVKSIDVGNDFVLKKDDRNNVVSFQGLRYSTGKEIDPGAGFVYYRHLPFYNSPTGTSDYRAAFKAWYSLQLVEGLRAVFLEKKSMPFVIGKATPSQIPSLNDVLSKMKSQNYAVVPTNVIVDALNIAGTADGAYSSAIKDLKHDIFIGIQLASLQQLEGTISDARGNSQVHQSASDLAKFHLGTQAQKVLNKINRDLIDVNFVVQHYPKITLSSVDVASLVQELQIDTGLNAMGMDLSKEEMLDRYGRTPPESPEDTLKGKPPGPGSPPAAGGPGAPPGSPSSPDAGFADQAPGVAVAPAAGFRGYSEQWLKYLERGKRRRVG